MKIRFIIIGVVLILLIASIMLVIVFTREGVVVKSGKISGGLSYVKDDTWSTSASKINGYCKVDKTFNSDNLAAFCVSSTNSDGKVFLKLIQGDVEKTIEITGEFNDKIDMSEFKSGRIRLRLEFEEAEDIDISISWK